MVGKNITAASEFLASGKLVAFPTETVYGLGADACSDEAVISIYNVKKRPSFNPLIIHSFSVEELEKYVIFNKQARIIAEKFWPGPLTLVLPRRNDLISLVVSCGLDTIAVRIPNHPVALQLLEKCKLPIAAPSANLSGKVSPTTASDVYAEIGSLISYVLDGGNCQVGIESTVLSLVSETPVILRPGAVTGEMLKEVLGDVTFAVEGSKIISPGMMKKHYSPSLPMEINAKEPKDGYAFWGFGKMQFSVTLNLSEDGNLTEAAANLFRFLRIVDNSEKFKGILISPIPETGVGYAINDRIKRAAIRD